MSLYFNTKLKWSQSYLCTLRENEACLVRVCLGRVIFYNNPCYLGKPAVENIGENVFTVLHEQITRTGEAVLLILLSISHRKLFNPSHLGNSCATAITFKTFPGDMKPNDSVVKSIRSQLVKCKFLTLFKFIYLLGYPWYNRTKRTDWSSWSSWHISSRCRRKLVWHLGTHIDISRSLDWEGDRWGISLGSQDYFSHKNDAKLR